MKMMLNPFWLSGNCEKRNLKMNWQREESNSSRDRGKGFKALNVNDGNPETYWSTPDDIKSASIIIDLGAETEVNRILIQEYIRLGQRVQEFKVEALVDGEWKQLIDGTTIGHKVIRKFPVVKTSQIKVTISQIKSLSGDFKY